MMLVDSRGWAKVKVAAHYAGVSERTFRGWLRDGMKHSRLRSGTILIRYTWIDEHLEKQVTANTDDKIKQIVESALEGVAN